jgi:hypothetical protein
MSFNKNNNGLKQNGRIKGPNIFADIDQLSKLVDVAAPMNLPVGEYEKCGHSSQI